jgi:hypothetical protein
LHPPSSSFDRPQDYYHYHTTANLAEPYLIRCLRGCIQNTNNNNALTVTASCSTKKDTAIKQDYSGFSVTWTANGAGAAGVGALLVAALLALSA